MKDSKQQATAYNDSPGRDFIGLGDNKFQWMIKSNDIQNKNNDYLLTQNGGMTSCSNVLTERILQASLLENCIFLFEYLQTLPFHTLRVYVVATYLYVPSMTCVYCF